MIKDDYDEARKSLRFYRRKKDVEEELKEIQVSVIKHLCKLIIKKLSGSF